MRVRGLAVGSQDGGNDQRTRVEAENQVRRQVTESGLQLRARKSSVLRTRKRKEERRGEEGMRTKEE